jgi:hypothetical protein
MGLYLAAGFAIPFGASYFQLSVFLSFPFGLLLTALQEEKQRRGLSLEISSQSFLLLSKIWFYYHYLVPIVSLLH